jgi:hypothetical protein
MVLHVPPFYGLNASKKNDNKNDINNRVGVSFIGIDVFVFGGQVKTGGGYDPEALSTSNLDESTLIGKIESYRHRDNGDV